MTGIDTHADLGRVTSQGVNPDDLFALLSTGLDSSDPNDSVELQDMAELAATYFGRGKLDDARDLIEEAINAGFSRPEALALREQIRSAQRAMLHTESAMPPERVRHFTGFTMPLPGVDTLPPAGRVAMNLAENDIRAGHLQSAQDAVMRAIALAPSFLPAYVRLAELREALGDDETPDYLLDALRTCLRMSSEAPDPVDLALRIILNPQDTSALVELARSAIANPGSIQLEPYVPNAIEQTMDTSPSTAKELAISYIGLRPASPVAIRNHVLALLANGDQQDAIVALEHDVRPDARTDMLAVRALAGYRETPSTWGLWMECAVKRLQAYPAELVAAIEALRRAQGMIQAPQMLLSEAVLRLAGNDAQGALTALDGIGASYTFPNHEESLLARCARAFALVVRSPIEAIGALTEAVGEAVMMDVRSFAEGSRLFRSSITAEALMLELTSVARATEQQALAIAYLQRLRDRLPEHLEIRTGLADLQIASGQVAEGVKELRHIAARYERAGNIRRMVEAMRRISDAVPGNAEIKAMLIDAYVHRGVPDEAERELERLGDLQMNRGKLLEAANAYWRGAEIASTFGSSEHAASLFDRAIAAAPDNVSYRHAAVAFHIMHGAVDAATPHLREIVRLALERDDPDEAVAALHQMIGLAPHDFTAYHRLGEVLTSLGEYAQAERVYRRLQTLMPDDPVLSAKQSALAALAAG